MRCVIQIGFIGIVEEDWISTLSTIDHEDIKYLDFIEEGRRLAKYLHQKVPHNLSSRRKSEIMYILASIDNGGKCDRSKFVSTNVI